MKLFGRPTDELRAEAQKEGFTFEDMRARQVTGERPVAKLYNSQIRDTLPPLPDGFERPANPNIQTFVTRLLGLKFPVVIKDVQINQEVAQLLLAQNILVFKTNRGSFVLCEYQTKDGQPTQDFEIFASKFRMENLVVAPTEYLVKSNQSELSQADLDYFMGVERESEQNTEPVQTNRKEVSLLNRLGKFGLRTAVSATQIIPGLKDIKQKMTSLEDTGFYKYNQNVVIPGQHSGTWGINVIDGYVDEETGIPIAIDLSDEAMQANPRVFLLRQLMLIRSGNPRSNHAFDFLKQKLDLTKKDLNLIKNHTEEGNEQFTRLIKYILDPEILRLDLSDEHKIYSMINKFDKNLSFDRVNSRMVVEAGTRGAMSGLYVAARVTNSPLYILTDAVRSGFDLARFGVKELDKIDPEVRKNLGIVTTMALIAKAGTGNIENPIFRSGAGAIVGVITAGVMNKVADQMAQAEIEALEGATEREELAIREKYAKQSQGMMRFYGDMSGILNAINNPIIRSLRETFNISHEEAVKHFELAKENDPELNRLLDGKKNIGEVKQALEDELRAKNIPVKGAIFNEIDEARNKDLNIKGGNLNQENELLNNNVGGKPVLDGDANTPNGNAGNQVLEDAKNSAGRTMERILPGATTTQLIDENAANAWANEWGNPVADRVQLVNAIQDIQNYFRAPGAGFDPAGAERAIHEILGHGNTTADITAEDIARIGAILSNARTSGFAGIDINAMLNVNHPDHGIAVAAAQRAIAARPEIFQNNPITHGFAYPGVLRFIGTPSIGATPALGGLLPPGGPGIVIGPVDFGAGPSDFLFNQLGVSREVAAGVGIITTGILGFLALRRRNNAGNQQYAQNNALGNGANAPLAYPPINVQRPGNPQNPNYAINNLFGQPFILTPEQFIVLPYQIRVMLLNPNLRWPANVLTWRRNRQLRTDLRNLVNNLRGIFPNNANQNIPILQALFNLNVLLNARRPNPQAINAAIDDVLRQYFLAYPPAGVNPVLPQAQVVQQAVVQQQPIHDNFGNRNNNNYNLIIPGVPDLGRITANLNTPNGQRLNTQRVNQLRDLAYAVLAIPQEFAGNLAEWRILQFQARRLLQVINRRGINRANPQEIEEINQFLANIVLAYNNANIRDPGLRQVAQNQVNDPAVDVGAHPNQRDVAQVDQPDHLPDFNFDNDDQFDDLNFDDDDDLVADQDQIDEFDRRIAELQRDLGFFPARDPGADANQQQRAQVARRQGQPAVADPNRVRPQPVVPPAPVADQVPTPVRPAVVSQDQGLQNVQPQDILNLDPNGIQQFQVIRNQTHIPPQLQPIDANRIPNINRAELNKFIGELIRLQQLLNNTTQTDEQATIQKLPNQYASLINFLINNFWDRPNTKIGRFLREFINRLSPKNENIVNQRANSNVKDNISLGLVVEANQNRQAIIGDLSEINTELQNLRDALNAIDNANSVIDDLRRLLGEVDYIRELSPEIRREFETRLKTLDVRIRELIKEVREFIQNPTQDGMRNIQNRINELYNNYDGLLTEIQKYFDRPVTQDDNLNDIRPTPDDPTPPAPAGPQIPNPLPSNPAPVAPQQNVAEIISAINEGTFNTINALLAHQAEEAQRNRVANAQDRQAIIDQHDQITTQLLERMDAMNQANTQANENLITELRNLVTRLNAEIEGLREQMDAVDQERRESIQEERKIRDQNAGLIADSAKYISEANEARLNAEAKANLAEELRKKDVEINKLNAEKAKVESQKRITQLENELNTQTKKRDANARISQLINENQILIENYASKSSQKRLNGGRANEVIAYYTALFNNQFAQIYQVATEEQIKMLKKLLVLILDGQSAKVNKSLINNTASSGDIYYALVELAILAGFTFEQDSAFAQMLRDLLTALSHLLEQIKEYQNPTLSLKLINLILNND